MSQQRQQQRPAGNGNKGKPTPAQGNPTNKAPVKKDSVQKARAQERAAAIVKSVISGDTVVLVLPEQTPPEEIQLTLLGLRAPTLGKKNKDGVVKDQPFAWESREYLRKLVIGKPVVYRVEHELGNRKYGEIWLESNNIRFQIVENGWAEASVREKKDKEGATMELRKEDQELLALQEVAKSAKRGVWKQGATGVRTVKYIENRKDASPETLYTFFEKSKGKTINAVVEQVRSGAILKVYAPASQEEFTVNLSGIHCPTFRYDDESASEPFSREAKFFTEHCLLNRDVVVTLECMDKFNNYYGTVLDAQHKRNIVNNLLKMGLGSFVEWNAPQERVQEWQETEKSARDAKLRIWKKALAAKGNNDSASGNLAAKEFLGTVVEIVNAGTVVVRVQKPDASFHDVNVTLSSVRVPRSLNARDASANSGSIIDELTEKEKKAYEEQHRKQEEEKIQNAYARQAKELLRKELIGKKVKCTLDYTSTPYQPQGSNKTLPARPHYTVTVGKTNVAIRLLRRGLATVALHQESDSRSPDYKDMILAEKAAEQEAVGLHAPKSRAPIVFINDLSVEKEGKCRHFLDSLKRVGKIAGIVEYTFSASRYKIYIPSQGLTIAFALQGVMADRPEKSDAPQQNPPNIRLTYPASDKASGNPIPANRALHFAREQLFQRDVEITVEDIDKSGTFFGSLSVNKTPFLPQLVESGYVKLHFTAERLPGYDQWKKFEDAAKSQNKGVWWDWNEAAEKAKAEAELKAREDKKKARDLEKDGIKGKDKFLVTVTEIMTGSTFFYQTADDETRSLMEDLMSDFQTRGWEDQPIHHPEVGEWVAGKFSADGSWYRAEVLRITPLGEFELRYIDYGNTEVVGADNIRAMDEELQQQEPQAHMGKLAYIRSPGLDEEFGEDAAALFKELVWGKTMLAQVQYRDGPVLHINLGDEETKLNINAALVIEGLARVESKRQTRVVNSDFYKLLEEEEKKAKDSRLNIWQYGAIPDSDEDRHWASLLR